PLATHRLELQVGADTLHACRVGRVLEMAAALAALQFQHTSLCRVPEWLRPLIRHRDRPCHLAPVAHLFLPTGADYRVIRPIVATSPSTLGRCSTGSPEANAPATQCDTWSCSPCSSTLCSAARIASIWVSTSTQ